MTFAPDAPCHTAVALLQAAPRLAAESHLFEIRFWAIRLATTAIEVSRWCAGNPDWRDLWWALSHDDESVIGQHRVAVEELAMACGRYRRVTGYDGLAVARGLIVDGFGSGVADAALIAVQHVLAAPEIDLAIDQAFNPPPTRQEVEQTIETLLSRAFSGPGMQAVREALGALHAAALVGDGGGTQAALAGLERACQVAVLAGAALHEVRVALALWADVSGGPLVSLNLIDPPPAAV